MFRLWNNTKIWSKIAGGNNKVLDYETPEIHP